MTAKARQRRGILVPLEFSFNDDFGALDGTHRIAPAIRLIAAAPRSRRAGLAEVPVELIEKPTRFHPGHAKPMHPEDLAVIRRAVSEVTAGRAGESVFR
jgi:hypothetical protein